MAATGTFSAGGYPTSEVRGRNQEDPMPKWKQPRGATPCPRPGAAAGRSNPTSKGAVAALVQEGLEELFHVQGQKGRW